MQKEVETCTYLGIQSRTSSGGEERSPCTFFDPAPKMGRWTAEPRVGWGVSKKNCSSVREKILCSFVRMHPKEVAEELWTGRGAGRLFYFHQTCFVNCEMDELWCCCWRAKLPQQSTIT